MKKVIFCFLAMFAISNISFADKYVLDDNAVDNAFKAATVVTIDNVNLFSTGTLNLMTNNASNMTYYSSRVNPWAAWAICTFLGDFGIHRHYLGTSSWMWAAYTFTCCGIFGIVPFVDWVVLLVGAIQDDVSSYTDNSKFIMWM